MALHASPVSILLAVLLFGIFLHLYRPFRQPETLVPVDFDVGTDDDPAPVLYRFRESDPIFKDALRPVSSSTGELPSLKTESIRPFEEEKAASTRPSNIEPPPIAPPSAIPPPKAPGHSYLDYRNQLTSSPYSPLQYKHTESLGFSHLYVVSLPSRSDRRKRMSDIAAALGARVTFIDATSTAENKSLINWIGERVLEVRNQKRKILSEVLDIDERRVGGMNVDCIWLARPESRIPNLNGYAYAHPETSSELRRQLPKMPSLADRRWNGLNWAERLDEADRENDHRDLTPDDFDFDLTKALWDHIERIPSRQIVPAVIATWHSHMKAVKSIIQNGDEAALILEDDVDM